MKAYILVYHCQFKANEARIFNGHQFSVKNPATITIALATVKLINALYLLKRYFKQRLFELIYKFLEQHIVTAVSIAEKICDICIITRGYVILVVFIIF